jgi:hypothetical protein
MLLPTRVSDMKWCLGLGFRAWVKGIVARIDTAVSDEDFKDDGKSTIPVLKLLIEVINSQARMQAQTIILELRLLFHIVLIILFWFN